MERRETDMECDGECGRQERRKQEIDTSSHGNYVNKSNVCIISSSPGKLEQGYFWLQAHPQPATWTWPPSATGPLPWDSEPQPFGAGPPKTP